MKPDGHSLFPYLHYEPVEHTFHAGEVLHNMNYRTRPAHLSQNYFQDSPLLCFLPSPAVPLSEISGKETVRNMEHLVKLLHKEWERSGRTKAEVSIDTADVMTVE